MSLPGPASSTSTPTPPTGSSLPTSPIRWSSPPLPNSESSPDPPSIVAGPFQSRAASLRSPRCITIELGSGQTIDEAVNPEQTQAAGGAIGYESLTCKHGVARPAQSFVA